MRLRTLLSPSTVFDRLGFIARCLQHRDLVDLMLADRRRAHRLNELRERMNTYLDWLLEDPRFAEELYQARASLSTYFKCKWDLAKMAFQEGTIFPEERPLLRKLVEESNALPGPIVEIGTLFGSTTILLALWKSPGKKIVTVDNYSWNPWQLSPVVHRKLTDQVLDYLSAKGEVEVICQDKQAFYDSYRGEAPALVFLDADHSYEGTKADIQWAKRVGAAIICGHDYATHCPGVGRAVEEEGGTQYHLHTLWALKTAYWERCQGEVPARSTPPADTERRCQIINQLYEQYFGRPADAGGLNYWLGVWAANQGPEMVRAGIMGASEYTKTVGGTPEAW